MYLNERSESSQDKHSTLQGEWPFKMAQVANRHNSWDLQPTDVASELSSLSLYEASHKAIPICAQDHFFIYKAKLFWCRKSQRSCQDSSPAFLPWSIIQDLEFREYPWVQLLPKKKPATQSVIAALLCCRMPCQEVFSVFSLFVFCPFWLCKTSQPAGNV